MVAVLTYRRAAVLQLMLGGLRTHCRQYPLAIFEDCGQSDKTTDLLQGGRRGGVYDSDLLAYHYAADADHGYDAYLGQRNLGVAGNSNRALRVFERSGADHLCLCNDDLIVDGDFVRFYAQAHADLGVDFLVFCDFTHHESYRWTEYKVRGYDVKMLPRMTGIMLSMTRTVLDRIGYFDAQFGQFGEEHCDYNHRARFAGCIQLNGQPMHCLDVAKAPGLGAVPLRHQECATSVTGEQRAAADQVAGAVMTRVCEDYRWRDYYRPYRLIQPLKAGGYHAAGTPVGALESCGYRLLPLAA